MFASLTTGRYEPLISSSDVHRRIWRHVGVRVAVVNSATKPRLICHAQES